MRLTNYLRMLIAAVVLCCGCGGGGGDKGGTSIAAPSGLVVQPGLSFDQVDLHWNAAPGAESYTVEVSKAGGSFEVIPGSLGGTITATSLTFDGNYPEGIQVGFRVRAQAGGKNSDPSASVLYDRGVRAPQNVVATPSPSNGTIKVEVSQTTLLATTLTIERQLTSGGEWLLVHTESCTGGSGRIITFNDADLVEGVSYRYRASQASGHFTSSLTESDSAQINLLPPAGLTLVGEPGQVHLRWTNRSAKATALSLVRTDNFGSGTVIPLPISSTEYVYALADITPVFLQLKVDGAGISAISTEVSGAPLPPAAPLPLKLEMVGLPNWTRMVGSASSPTLLSYDSSWPYTPRILLPGENTSQGVSLPDLSVYDFRLDAQSRPTFAGTVRKDYNTMQYTIRYGYRNGGSIMIEDVATEGLSDANLRFSVDPSGQPHLVWKSLSDGTAGYPSILRYATRSGGVWTPQTLLTDAAGNMEFGCTSDGTLWLLTWTSQHLQLGSKAPGRDWVWIPLPADQPAMTWKPRLSLPMEASSFGVVSDGFLDSTQANNVTVPIQLSLKAPTTSLLLLTDPMALPATGNLKVFASAAAKGRLAMVVGASQNAATYPWMSYSLTLLIRNADGQIISKPLGTMTTMGGGMALLFDDNSKVRFYFNSGYHQGLGSEKVLTLVASE